jgi:hypothetical protein
MPFLNSCKMGVSLFFIGGKIVKAPCPMTEKEKEMT